MLVKQAEKRKPLNTIQVRATPTFKKHTPISVKSNDQDTKVEANTSKRKLNVLERDEQAHCSITDEKGGFSIHEDDNELLQSNKKPKFQISSDEGEQSSDKCRECQTKEGINFITSDEPSLQYWKELADQRQIALQAALRENEALHEISEQRRIALEAALKENESLHDEVEVLETENSELKVMVEQAKHLTELLESLNSDDK